ncbi:ABC transporter permease [Variovorax terrae]|uniref:ABC transporter permease n=1 Tax=Variovorax terrae TaxID=2923278 RepID=A0A9X2ARM6_9BURK|nr:ABC transporter permease [Variovorax terrae]MCJ0764346.1 ABC transporter permease [Variovorax terrae]
MSTTETPDDLPTLNDAQLRRERSERRQRVIAPLLVLVALLVAWELVVRVNKMPPYILPGPILVLQTLWESFPSLLGSLVFTAKLTLMALGLAVVGGVAIGTLFALSRIVEISLFPYAVVLQVTPIIAIAPLIMIYVDSTLAALLICAWIVAFFPILSNTVIGLRSADHNLRDLYTLYRATPWQRFRYLLVPSALPYFMAGLKVAGGLALIGAVVAEFVAGAAGKETGLASRILEASFRNEIPRMFAALLLVSLCGIVIFLACSWLSRKVLGHWHESELKREH